MTFQLRPKQLENPSYNGLEKMVTEHIPILYQLENMIIEIIVTRLQTWDIIDNDITTDVYQVTDQLTFDLNV